MKKYIKSSGPYPDFKKIAEAQRFLDSQDPDKVELVDDCYCEILDMFADYNNMCTHLNLRASIYGGKNGLDFTDETILTKLRTVITILVKMYGVSLAN